MGSETWSEECPMKHLHKKDTTNGYMGWIVLVLMAVMLAVIWFILPVKKRGKETTKDKKHRVVITGGSQGIGLALAHEFVRNGTCCHVTLLARTKSKLEEAQKELLKVSNDVIVDFYPVDVTNPKAIQKVAEEICKSSSTTPDMLFNVAGTAISRSFLDADIGDFSHLMNLNYLGSVYTTKAFLPFMLAAHHKRDRINIMFTSSAAGQTGVYGYSAYTPTKFALRGFAECLQMEHARDNVHIQVCFPPDTETPGYTIEQIGKPKETMLISEVAGLYKPEQVAEKMAYSALLSNPPFFVYFGLEGWMLATLTAGMSPVFTMGDALYQICLMSILRLVSLFYLFSFYDIISKEKKTNEEPTKVGETQPLVE